MYYLSITLRIILFCSHSFVDISCHSKILMSISKSPLRAKIELKPQTTVYFLDTLSQSHRIFAPFDSTSQGQYRSCNPLFQFRITQNYHIISWSTNFYIRVVPGLRYSSFLNIIKCIHNRTHCITECRLSWMTRKSSAINFIENPIRLDMFPISSTILLFCVWS